MHKNNLIFDHQQIEIFRNRAHKKFTEASDFLLAYVTEDLKYRLQDINRIFTNALDLHSYTNIIAQTLLNHNIKNVIRVETSELFLKNFNNILVADRENINNIPNNLDLITSFLSMQFINNIPNYLKIIKNKLKPDGLFIGALLGQNSLNELRNAFIEAELICNIGVSPRIAPFMELKNLGDLFLNSGFSFPVVDSEEIIVEYENFETLLKDLKSWGMQNALSNRSKLPISKKVLNTAKQIYNEKYKIENSNNVKATFSILWFSAWAPCASHIKPAKPGSAKVSLRDVL